MPQLTEHQWKLLEPLLENIDRNRQAAAYNRLVKGMTLASAGAPYGYSRQDVSIITEAVRKHYDRLNKILTILRHVPPAPAGWVAVTFYVPKARAPDARRVIETMYPQPDTTARRTSRRVSPGAEPPATKRRQASP